MVVFCRLAMAAQGARLLWCGVLCGRMFIVEWLVGANLIYLMWTIVCSNIVSSELKRYMYSTKHAGNLGGADTRVSHEVFDNVILLPVALREDVVCLRFSPGCFFTPSTFDICIENMCGMSISSPRHNSTLQIVSIRHPAVA